MPRRATPLAALVVALTALSAEARPDCELTTHLWELQLVQVAAVSGSPDLQSVAKALGRRATLRGGYHDPARPKDPARAELHGSTDGAGLNILLESAP